jgi:hypothetical protein
LAIFAAAALPAGSSFAGAAVSDIQFLVNRFVIDGESPIGGRRAGGGV